MEVMGLGCALGMGKRRAVGRKSQMFASLMNKFQAREGNAPGELLEQRLLAGYPLPPCH